MCTQFGTPRTRARRGPVVASDPGKCPIFPAAGLWERSLNEFGNLFGSLCAELRPLLLFRAIPAKTSRRTRCEKRKFFQWLAVDGVWRSLAAR
jgi:hypothetical protein